MTFVAVCGGRDFHDKDLLGRILAREIKATDVIVTGAARGADTLARVWAQSNFCQVIEVPAQWETFGRAAGARRNAVIAALPLRLLIAFPGGVGTGLMMKMARARDIPVVDACQG